MNFFFCETCGKRVTEEDLQQGTAHDKQLKGIYCQQCAVGVKTAEIAAITQDQLERNKVAQAPTQSALLPVAASDNKRSSRFNLIALRNEEPAPALARLNALGTGAGAGSGNKPRQESSHGVVIASIAGAVVLVVVGILITASGTSSKTAAAHNETSAEPEKVAAAAPAAPTSSTAPANAESRKPSAPPCFIVPSPAPKPAVTEKTAKPATPPAPTVTPATPVPPASPAITTPAPANTEQPKAEPPKVAAKPPDKPKPAVVSHPATGLGGQACLRGRSADQVRFAIRGVIRTNC